TGRCGTKLLTQLLEKVPATACFHAPQPELLSYEKLAYEQGESNFEAFKLLISACRFELMADCFVRGRRYIETNQRITFFAPHLYELFPQARFIHLVRNPYSFVRTGAALNYYEGQYADLGRITPIEGPAAIQWPHMSIYQRCAWLWNETNEFIERFKAQCDPSRVLTVLAEDLFDNPETTLTILRHCRLPELPISTISKCLKRKVNSNPHKGKLNRVDQDDQKWKDAIQPWSLNASRYHYAM
ncbi:MAG: sulfotransferase, partial [Pirellulales bacterium]|nr:sulfotransferase [Pirellulales bacterium]